MRLCMFLPASADRRWTVARQMGVTRAIAKLAPDLTGRPPPHDRASLQAAIDAYGTGGFEIVGLEGDQFDMGRIKFGLPGREADLDLYCRMLEEMGRAGIRLLCLNFMAGIGWYRTRTAIPARGGATVSGFEAALATGLTEHGEVPAGRIWENFAWFITRIAPVAEAAGVRLGLHPDDPPVPSLRGIGRILTSVEALEQAITIADSPAVGVTFCQGSLATAGADVIAAARRFGRDRIHFVHVRDVRGTATDFVETFPEDGQTDMAAMFRTYAELGLDCPVRPDHAPAMAGDRDAPTEVSGANVGYEANGMIYTVGFMKGLMRANGWTDV